MTMIFLSHLALCFICISPLWEEKRLAKNFMTLTFKVMRCSRDARVFIFIFNAGGKYSIETSCKVI